MEIAKQILRVRLGQMMVNQRYKNKEFKVPIHLAMGHEAIAVAIDRIMQDADRLCLSHRNIHYNLARQGTVKPEIDEYLLDEDGLNQGRSGSMNLSNKSKGIVYTSSILGNNLPVAAGLALGEKVKGSDGVVIVVTGDGAMEEGTFYESFVFARSNELPLLIVVENNGWSLATTIPERRYHVNIEIMAESLDVDYMKLCDNDTYEYIEQLERFRTAAVDSARPGCIEVELGTLGHWWLKTKEHPDGKFINYHAGPAPTVDIADGPMICDSDEDPVFVLRKHFSEAEIEKMAHEVLSSLKEEMS